MSPTAVVNTGSDSVDNSAKQDGGCLRFTLTEFWDVGRLGLTTTFVTGGELPVNEVSNMTAASNTTLSREPGQCVCVCLHVPQKHNAAQLCV